MTAVFVCGPQGCGKSTNKELLRKKLKMANVVDGWSLGDRESVRDRTLYLTNEPVESVRAVFPGAATEVLSYDEAMA